MQKHKFVDMALFWKIDGGHLVASLLLSSFYSAGEAYAPYFMPRNNLHMTLSNNDLCKQDLV